MTDGAPSQNIESVIAAANAPLEGAGVTRVVGSDIPRFELYHFALSLCSQKVRTCLAEKKASYIAQDLNVSLPLLGNYDPSYVRLRLLGRPEGALATGYTGRSAVETEGFDPAVVPTLVDRETERVITDSARICRYLDTHVRPEDSLIPPEHRDAVLREVAIVDGTPHVALLYGAHPDHDFRPERLRRNMPGVHDRKIAKIEQARDMVPEDAVLREAYEAKIAKEFAGKGFVNDPARMRRAVEEVLSLLSELEERLSDGRRYLCGDTLTLADLVWSVSLFRLKWLGMAFAWEGGHPLSNRSRPHVEAYGRMLFSRRAFRAAVIDWPGVPRTEFVSDHYDE